MITVKHEHARGCGYRKPGGLYLVAGRIGGPCGKLPIPLTVCPCCNQGIKFSRGFTWIGHKLVSDAPCATDPCRICPVWHGRHEKYGLLWVGEKFYPTPDDFIRETERQGVSKRIATVPKDFVLGVDWVLLAHRKVIHQFSPPYTGDSELTPGIFQAFKPTAIEYVVRGDESNEELDRLEKRGITLVEVKPIQAKLI